MFFQPVSFSILYIENHLKFMASFQGTVSSIQAWKHLAQSLNITERKPVLHEKFWFALQPLYSCSLANKCCFWRVFITTHQLFPIPITCSKCSAGNWVYLKLLTHALVFLTNHESILILPYWCQIVSSFYKEY